MKETKESRCRLKKPLIILLILAVLSLIGWLVYYFFFEEDDEELDESLFGEDAEQTAPEKTSEVTAGACPCEAAPEG